MRCSRCGSDNPADSDFCGKCGTSIRPPSSDIPAFQTETLKTRPHELPTGSTFAGRYQIIEELGKGGMGRVYRVLDKKLNEEVALKLIQPEIAADAETIGAVQHRAEARPQDQPPEHRPDVRAHGGRRSCTSSPWNTSRAKTSGASSGGPGSSPSERRRPSRRQVCEGLSEAHRLGVIHRDLKPSNIMIDKAGNARIMDFGIARSLEAKGITGAGVMIGTPEYMSPEQVEGKEADQRSDIYSLGIILFEMMTGRLPFEGETPLSVAVKQKSEPPPDPAEAQHPDPGRLRPPDPQMPGEIARRNASRAPTSSSPSSAGSRRTCRPRRILRRSTGLSRRSRSPSSSP